MMKRQRIKTKLSAMVSLIITVAFLTCILACIFTFSLANREDASKYLESVVSNVSSDLTNLIEDIEYITAMPYYSDVADILIPYAHQDSHFLLSKDRTEIIHMLQFINESKSFIKNSYIAMPNGLLITRGFQDDISSWDSGTNQWLSGCDRSGALSLIPSHRTLFKGDEYAISFVRMMKDRKSHEDIAFLVLDLNMDQFQMCVPKSLPYSEQIYVYSTDGTIYYPYDAQITLDELNLVSSHRQQNNLIVEQSIGKLNLHVVGVLYPDLYTNSTFSLMKRLIAIYAVVLCLSLMIVLRFSAAFVQPINNLKEAMKRLTSREFDTHVTVQGTDELAELGNGFNWMVEQMKKMIEDINAVNEKEKRVMISLLQRQIGPHFIYNSLESMNAMALAAKQYELSNGIVALSHLMRHASGNAEDTISLHDELQFVDDYIRIQMLISGIKVVLHKSLDFSHECLLVPKFILQPLVENTFKHSGSKAEVDIYIRSAESENLLLLTIENNGAPMEKERMDQICQLLSSGEIGELDRKGKKGTALANIHMRIRLMYGEEYGLEFPPQPCSGFAILVKLPVIWPMEDENETVDY